MKQMIQSYVLAYDRNRSNLSALQNMLAARHIKMFGSDNIYRLLKYMEELQTDVFLLTIHPDDKPAETLLAELPKRNFRAPLVILKPQQLTLSSDIKAAHYLTEFDPPQKLIDILESYHLGSKRHKVMIFHSYQANLPDEQNYCRLLSEPDKNNCFEVYNQEAAQQYLSKNNPDAICIEHGSPFTVPPHLFPNQHIFYVDRQQDIAEIKNFLH
ncbi:MAG: hypothetical protein Q4D80_05555 [Pseudomonadota bacterium]|nr:hypothetical protein [Pseudomonadota bacterium]